MSVEMACGKCQGRFLVAAPGTVACPHCGTHLLIAPESVPDAPPAGEVQTPAPSSEAAATDAARPEQAASQTVPPEAEPSQEAASGDVAPAPPEEKFANYAGLADAAASSVETAASEPEPDEAAPAAGNLPSAPAAEFPPAPAAELPAVSMEEFPAVGAEETPSQDAGEPDNSEPDNPDNSESNNKEPAAEPFAQPVPDDAAAIAAEPVNPIDSASAPIPLTAEAATNDPLASSADEETLPDFSLLERGDDSHDPHGEPSFDFAAKEEATVSFEEGGWPPSEPNAADDPVAEGFAGLELPRDAGHDESSGAGSFPDFSETPAAGTNDTNGAGDAGENQLAASAGSGEFSAPEQSASDGETESAAAVTPAPSVSEASPVPSSAAQPVAATTGDPGISRFWFVLLASYASAMTIVCVWLWLQQGTHQLESLEDPAETRVVDNKRVVTLLPVDAALPRGHELELGESRRFGNVLVEPIKVTRAPLEFTHFTGEKGRSKTPTEPVLKLWLRFKNVSADQTIAPLDLLLLYTNRVPLEDNFEELRGNTFLCRHGEERHKDDVVYVYRFNTDDEWDLRGQELKELGPGESLVTYVPSSTAGIDELTGDLMWRVHFRKGYSPSNHGLTTLFDVRFHSDEIQSGSSRSSSRATASL